jgi:hypothetical protein
VPPRKPWVEKLRVATRCPACGTEDPPPPGEKNVVPLVVPAAGRPVLEPGRAVLGLFNEEMARTRRFLVGTGHSYAFRACVCRACGFVLWFFDEEVTNGPRPKEEA